jgi:hypothetical protein
MFMLFCAGSGLATGLIPYPRSPILIYPAGGGTGGRAQCESYKKIIITSLYCDHFLRLCQIFIEFSAVSTRPQHSILSCASAFQSAPSCHNLWCLWQYYFPVYMFVSNPVSSLEDFRSDICKMIIISPTHIMLSRDWVVIIGGFLINDRIYWTLWYSAWLQFTIHYHTHLCPQSRLY